MFFLTKKEHLLVKLLKNNTLWVGVVYFLILLGIALWVRDIPYQRDAFNLTLQQVIDTSREMGDPASFATAAIDIAKHGWLSSANVWIIDLWPPGFILLEALIIKVLGANAPVILVLQVLAAALFSIVLALLYALLNERIRSRVVFIFPLLIFAFPVSRVFLLQPTGISLGESFSIGFFLIFILLALRSVQQNSLRDAVYAGLCLALSAYFRSQFEIILLVLTGWGVLLALIVFSVIFKLRQVRNNWGIQLAGAVFSIVFRSRPMRNGRGILLAVNIRLNRFDWGFLLAMSARQNPLRNIIAPQVLKSAIKTIAVVLLIAHAATVPWRAYHWTHQGSPFWVHTSSIIFTNSVMTSEFLESVNGGFVVAGAGNLVCRIDPTTCGDTVHAKKLFVKTFITHPVEWYSLKLDIIGNYWFSSLQNWVGASNIENAKADLVANGLILIALIVLVALLFTRRIRFSGLWILLMWFNISLFSAYMLIFTAAHFEVRYFYFPKIAAVAMLIIVAGLHCRAMSTSDFEMNFKDACNRFKKYI